MGRKVASLLDEYQDREALMEVVWDGMSDQGSPVASGTYFVKMRAPDCDPKTLKISLIK